MEANVTLCLMNGISIRVSPSRMAVNGVPSSASKRISFKATTLFISLMRKKGYKNEVPGGDKLLTG